MRYSRLIFSSCILLASALESAISLISPGSFQGKMVCKTKIWVLSMLVATGMSWLLSVYLSTYLHTCVCMYHLSIDPFIFVYVYTHTIIYSFINYFHIYLYVYYRTVSSYPTSNSNPTPQGSLRLPFYICKCLLRQ